MRSDHSESKHSAKFWFGVASAVVAALFLLGLLGYWFWAQSQLRNLKRTLAELSAAGEPMTFAQLLTDSIPDSANASLTYHRAALAVNKTSVAWQRYNDSRDPQGYRAPLSAAETADVAALVAENKTALDLCVAARSQTPSDWHDPWTQPYLLASTTIELNSARGLANLLRLDAEYQHATGHEDACVQRLHDIVRLADASMKRASLVAHLVAVGIRAMAGDAAGHLAPRLDPKVDPAGVNSLAAALLDHSAQDAGRRLAYQSERIMQTEMFTRFLNGQFVQNGNANAAIPPTMPAIPFISPLLASDAASAAKAMVESEHAARAPNWPANQAAMPKAFYAQLSAHPIRHLLSSILMPSFNRAGETDYRLLAESLLAAVALECRLFEIDHGHVPTTLADLVPQYLPAIPDDPMATGNASLRLATSNGQPRVYSVGINGIDDGGTEALESGPARLRDAHRDIVIHLRAQPRTPYVDEDAPPATAPAGR